MQVLDQTITDKYALYHGDSVEVFRALPDNSVGLTITSPPFCNLYTYSNSVRDMGNTRDDAHFMQNFRYLIPELLRVTKPGRLVVIHCKDMPLFYGSDGMAGLRDFPGELVKAFCGTQQTELLAQLDALEALQGRLGKTAAKAVGAEIEQIKSLLKQNSEDQWGFHSRVTIWKDPKIERERTNNSGLLHGQLCRDSAASRQGMADYLLVFRKWSPEMDGIQSPDPVTRHDDEIRFSDYIGEEPPEFSPEENPRNFSIHTWRKYASPTWHDINQTDVLNANIARAEGEPHICPLQLDLIARCIELWSNPGDVICDPFNGVGSTGYMALKAGRRYLGGELKEQYYKAAAVFLEQSANALQGNILSEVA